MSISDWPEADRPREKLLQRGPQALTDAELLAIFLRTGVKGKSALDLAQDLLKEFGDLRSLLSADREKFCKAKGLGNAKYVQLQATVELTKRYLRQCLHRSDVLSSPEDTRNYLLSELSGRVHEVFGCLFLDTKNRVIKFKELFYGTIDGASVHPREVVRHVIQYNAAAVIFAHNHPSGIAEPSKADIAITQQLKEILQLLDVRVLDHFIIGDGYGVSLAERGLI
jgi:DNA repair protein RadC